MAQSAQSFTLPGQTAAQTGGGLTSAFTAQIPIVTASGNNILINTKPDVSLIVQSDPSLMNGYRLVYDRKCPFTLHVVAQELIEKVGHTIQQSEELRVKILAKGPEEYPDHVKVELFGLSDYFFVYGSEVSFFDYQEMRERQELTPQFADYLTMLIKLFNSALNNPDTYRLQIQLNPDNSSDLFFNQILPYKQLQMLGIHLEIVPIEQIQRHIKYKQQMALINLEKMQAKLSVVCKQIKDKNPSLIHHICKEVQNLRPYGEQLDMREIKRASRGPRSAKSNRSRTSGGPSRRSSRRSVASSVTGAK